MSPGEVVEGYVADSDLRSLENDYLLSPASRDRANVILHVIARGPEDPEALDLDDVARSALVLCARMSSRPWSPSRWPAGAEEAVRLDCRR